MSRKNFGVEFDLFEDFENIEGNNVLKESVLKAIEESQNLDAAERGSRIEDFGEKIGGARKDLYEAYYELMKSAVTTELESAPLSKTFPVPNYNKLIERGIERWKVGEKDIFRQREILIKIYFPTIKVESLSFEEFADVLITWENRGCCAHFRAHVCDCRTFRDFETFRTLAGVFVDLSETALVGYTAQHFEDHVLSVAARFEFP